MTTLYDVQASLKTFLEEKTGLTCVWIYDGVELTESKPFVTIESIQTEHSVVDKMRELAESTFHFQIGVYTKTSAEKAKIPDEIRRVLTFEQVPLLDTSQPSYPTVSYFNADVERVVPLPNDELSKSTDNHRAYLDVIVELDMEN